MDQEEAKGLVCNFGSGDDGHSELERCGMPYLQRRRCLFGHSAGEVAAALLVGSEAPRDDVLVLAAEVRG